jgi:proteasome alpha subunit
VSTPFYVSPEQLMKDRADFARKGIARGRSVVVVQYADGILFVAVGRYNEFENLRIAGVRLADMRGYSYDRRDVTGRGLANAYAQTLGTIFSSGGEKPYEVELFVAEVGDAAEDDQIYRLTYDGSVADEHGFAVMGGSAEHVSEQLQSSYSDGLDLAAALTLAVDALGRDGEQPREITADKLEVAVIDRTRTQPRKFRRLTTAALESILGPRVPTQASAPSADDEASTADEPAASDEPTTDASDPSDEVGDLPPEP